MKATTIIIAAVLSLQASVLLADNNTSPVMPNSDANASCCISLVPVAPVEATFEDDTPVMDYTWLAPLTPREAAFDDGITSADAVILQNLAPVAPKEADFSDDDVNQTVNYSALVPRTPVEADFSSLL